jgi:hypothetical protein
MPAFHLGLRGALALSVMVAFGARCPAQNPYVPYYPGGYRPGVVGGALQGQASVISASGDLMIKQEQARIERQKADQEKLVTKKKSFEQMMWEKAHTATYTETAQYETGLILQRMMTSPTAHEITSAKTLNAMLPMIKTLASGGVHGPPIYLDPNQLKQINVTVGKDGKNIGMLKGPKLTWPLCLQGNPAQKKIEALLPQAMSLAAMGSLDQKTYRELTASLANLTDDLRRQFQKETIDGGEFLEGQRFLEPLTKSVQALRDPTSQRVLDGTYSARGRNVQELCDYMTKQGLSFAGGNPGSEAAYYSLHDSLVAYTTNAEAAAGFHVQYIPPRAAAFK